MQAQSPAGATLVEKYSNLSLVETDGDGPLSDVVYRSILEAMFRGDLKGGDSISEFALARALGVSRTPVHLAVRDLMYDGLIVKEGTRRPSVAKLARQDLIEIFEMRRLLETEAARRAASQIGRDQLSSLRKTINEIRELPEAERLTAWSEFDDVFHVVIARSCGHRRLAEDIERYRRVHFALNTIRMRADLVSRALDEHEVILDALDARDPEAAANAMTEHLAEWQAYYASMFSA